MNKKDWAFDNYEKVIQKDGNNDLAHQLKGQSLLLSGEGDNNYEKALDEFDIGLKLKPENSQCTFLKAFTLSKLGKSDEAIENYKKIIEQNHDKDKDKDKENDCTANYNIGIILSKNNKNDEAKEYFNKALEINPKFSKAKLALSMLDKPNNIDEALKQLEQENKDDEEILLMKGNLLFVKEKYDEALPLYEEIISKIPKNEDVLLGLANCLYKNNQKDEAAQKYVELLLQNNNSQNALFNKGLILYENGNSDEAYKLFDQALQIKESPTILMQQGVCLLRDENYKEALNKFDDVLKLDDKNAKAHVGRPCSGRTKLESPSKNMIKL